MKILAVGDVVGARAVEYLQDNLWKIRNENQIEFTVVNGENAAEIHGISALDAKTLISSGADLITLGNHTYGRRDICELLSESESIIRPANYPPMAPGGGYTLLNINGWRVLGINILGTALMESLACPFSTVDRILEREKGNYDFAILDIHAETTSEKLALARYFDGRIAVIFGTHTHVQTADEQILPNGSGYITDLGMTGPVNGIIGTEADAVIEKFRTKMPVRFRVADGEIRSCGAIFDLDTDTKKVKSVRRIVF
ncbi:MAG: YmdB family metallophosphoesterase [Ruminococcaceae bacterium]|nr:YmdB family metallophosphoesterase [Oscillospiraceae bacterium]